MPSPTWLADAIQARPWTPARANKVVRHVISRGRNTGLVTFNAACYDAAIKLLPKKLRQDVLRDCGAVLKVCGCVYDAANEARALNAPDMPPRKR